MLMSLSYVSLARRAVESTELARLAGVYRRNNERDGITGMLVYHDLRFMQVIEGTPETIQALFGKIQVDPLHHQVVVLFDDPVPDREFLNWSLGLVHGTDLAVEDRTVLNRFLADADAHPTSPHLARQGSRMLRHFRDVML